ncbi:MAG TPA: hypothetical protein PKV69_01890, partial [Candidatus Hydrogenedentes bacterium]|nr:hypothetical protein [Candidatus Hydrogenedentota bacterium]
VPAGSPDGETYDLPISTAVTLTAIPDSNSVFTGWSGDLPPGSVPDVPVLNVVMNQNRTITATFVPADFTLTVNVAGTANPVNVTPPPGVYGYLAGQTAVVIALPASGSPAAFDLWTGSAITNNAIVPLTMDSNKVMTANYVDDNGSNTFGLTVTAPGGDGSGAYFPLSPGSYRVLSNRTLFFGANPNPGSFFGGWTGSYAGVNTPQELAVRMDQDRTVGAVFSATGTTVTVALSGRAMSSRGRASMPSPTGWWFPSPASASTPPGCSTAGRTPSAASMPPRPPTTSRWMRTCPACSSPAFSRRTPRRPCWPAGATGPWSRTGPASGLCPTTRGTSPSRTTTARFSWAKPL